MSSAEALLNSLADEQLLSETYTESDHFVIGEDHYITVPESLKRIAVQYDHNMETITFDCPRHWDGRDMSLMKIYINYILPNSSTGTYIAENITVDKDDFNIMHFDWTIKNHVTQYKGNIKFLVCVRKTDDNGVQTNHWNSELCTDCYISEGLETGSITNKQYSDLATQLLTMIGNAETTIETTTHNQIKTIQNESKTQQTAVEAKGAATLATIPEDYTATQLSIPRVANLTLKAGKTYILSGGSQSAQVTVRDTSATMHYATSYGDPTTFTAAENTSVSIYIRVDTGITVDTVIYPMLQLGDFEDTTFESSAGRQTLTLITPTGLPGMDELSVYDVIDLKRGVHIHNVGRANLADYTDYITKSDNSTYSNHILRFDFGYCFGTTKTDPLYCNRFRNTFAHGDNQMSTRNTECISTHSVNDLVSVFIEGGRLPSQDANGFIYWLGQNETIIQYRLAEPYETELTDAEIVAYKALMTNYPNTTITNSAWLPMVISYNVDTKTYIDNRIKELINT